MSRILSQVHHPLGRYTPWAGTPPSGQPPPLGRYSPPGRYTPRADTPPWSMSRWYASYWNAFLFMQIYGQQECIPVGCIPPAAVAIRGGSPPGTPLEQIPPRTRHPPFPADQAPPWDQAPPPRADTPTPPPGPGTSPPPVNRITDACKNITLPQLRCGR